MQCLLPSNGLAGAGHEAGLSAAPAAEAEPAEAAAEPRETLAARLRRQGWDGGMGRMGINPLNKIETWMGK